jgi:guanylate kinase
MVYNTMFGKSEKTGEHEMPDKKRFTVLSGPSCVGKGPLVAALKRFHPDMTYSEIPVIKSWESRDNRPRPDEVAIWDNEDYFRSAETIRTMSGDQYLVGECRGYPQAVDQKKIAESTADLLFIEIYYTIGMKLLSSSFLSDVAVTTLFLSPLGRDEIDDLKVQAVDLPTHVKQLMIQKQLARERFQGKKAIMTKNVDERATVAYDELCYACMCDRVIVNHDSEGSPNWHRLPGGSFTSPPEGDAGRALMALLYILAGVEAPISCENWHDMAL